MLVVVEVLAQSQLTKVATANLLPNSEIGKIGLNKSISHYTHNQTHNKVTDIAYLLPLTYS